MANRGTNIGPSTNWQLTLETMLGTLARCIAEVTRSALIPASSRAGLPSG